MTDLDRVIDRLRRLEDTEAVRATVLDYCHQLDLGDLAALGDVFAEDAVLEVDGLGATLDGRYQGRRPILDFYASTGFPTDPSAPPRLMTGHLVTNLQIELDGDGATTLGYFFEIVGRLVLVGTYQHRLQRDADRWRFAFKRISIRYRALVEATDLDGQPFAAVVAKPVSP